MGGRHGTSDLANVFFEGVDCRGEVIAFTFRAQCRGARSMEGAIIGERFQRVQSRQAKRLRGNFGLLA